MTSKLLTDMYKNKGYKTEELSSRIIKAGHRVYFIDAKEDSQGNRYIALSECKSSLKGGGRDRQRIHVYEEDVMKLFGALSEVALDLGYKINIERLGIELGNTTGSEDALNDEHSSASTSVDLGSIDQLLNEE